MRVELLSIGTELALGQTVDTNSAWLARELAELGLLATRHVTVADDVDAIADAFSKASLRADLVLCTGGLGPTLDDLTRQALANAAGVELLLSDDALAQMTAYFAARGRVVNDNNKIQAYMPAGSRVVHNPAGTAPGIAMNLNGCCIFCVAGVPREMKAIWSETLRPTLCGEPSPFGDLSERLAAFRAGPKRCIRSTVIQVIGVPESDLGAAIADLMARDRNPNVGTTAKGGIIGVRINADAPSPDEAEALIARDRAEVLSRFTDHVFGEGEHATLADATAKLLIDHKLTLATAESCTAGLIASMLAETPGSSAFLIEGLVTYSNQAKTERLGVPAELIDRHGAVSPEVAIAMAEGARKDRDFGLSVTGIAGPDGGSAEKPVGTIHVGLARRGGDTIHRHAVMWGSDRNSIRDRAAKFALDLLRRTVLNRPPTSS